MISFELFLKDVNYLFDGIYERKYAAYGQTTTEMHENAN